MYRSEQFVLPGGKPIPIIIRNYDTRDFNNLIEIQAECFPPPFPSDLWWTKEQLYQEN